MFSPTPTSSTTYPDPTVEIIDGKILALPPETTSTVTKFVTVIVTVLLISTSTSTVEVVVTDTVTPNIALPATTTVDIVTVTVVPSPSKPTNWTAPAQMADLSALNITNFAGGSQDLIVNNLSANSSTEFSNSSAPAEVVTFEVSSDHSSNNDSSTVWTNATLLMGGKLPGLYGGRQGCSGGDAAVDCFSTRPMWRKDGQGELYVTNKLIRYATILNPYAMLGGILKRANQEVVISEETDGKQQSLHLAWIVE
ncbi:hypothetical protein HHX47_DHR9000532 [Lentinula edodes]|nr:hypothetical protein HHX47_DHR9000532 [Lentinula edodes]